MGNSIRLSSGIVVSNIEIAGIACGAKR